MSETAGRSVWSALEGENTCKDELRSLIKVLDHHFDIIGITETRLYEDTPLVNIEID